MRDVEVDTTNRSIAGLAVAVVAADQVTKHLALAVGGGGPIDPTTNPSFSLGLADAPTTIEILVAAAGIVCYGVFLIRRARAGRLGWWVPGLVVGGALSNLVDRVAVGAVHDFLATPWVVFNLADVAVLLGVTADVITRFASSTRREVTP